MNRRKATTGDERPVLEPTKSSSRKRDKPDSDSTAHDKLEPAITSSKKRPNSETETAISDKPVKKTKKGNDASATEKLSTEFSLETQLTWLEKNVASLESEAQHKAFCDYYFHIEREGDENALKIDAVKRHVEKLPEGVGSKFFYRAFFYAQTNNTADWLLDDFEYEFDVYQGVFEWSLTWHNLAGTGQLGKLDLVRKNEDLRALVSTFLDGSEWMRQYLNEYRKVCGFKTWTAEEAVGLSVSTRNGFDRIRQAGEGEQLYINDRS